MRKSVYITNAFLKPILPLLNRDWHAVGSWDSSVDKQSITALATTVWDPIDAQFLSQFPNLNIICHLGLGTDNLDKDYLTNHHITLLSQPHAGVYDTSELALTLMLSLARKIIPNHQYTRNNQWAQRAQGNHLRGKQLGLVGLGQIGSTIAKLALAFEMHIAYHARNKLVNDYRYYIDVNSLAAHSDFLIVCCAGGSETFHLINQSTLEHLGPNGYLINVARGSIVDEVALIQALQNATIAGAGLDVYAHEPEVPEALRMLDNVVLSPHMGSSTKENLHLMFTLQAQQLNDYLVDACKE
jgi:lactate dehydrogenase-like 2-hydroxyacid dehydrogenase